MNLAKLTINKIDKANLKIEVYRLLPQDLAEIDDFYLLTDLQREKYLFATIDQDKYFEANFTDEIVLYDVDKYTYDHTTKFERESVGVQYHSFLSESMFSYEPIIKENTDSFVITSYYNANPINPTEGSIKITYFLVVKRVFMQSTQPECTEQTIKVQGFTNTLDRNTGVFTIYVPGLYQLVIKRSKENNRLIQYGDKYYYVLPALDFDFSNSGVWKKTIQQYCRKLGGKLMIINSHQELAIANYMAQQFTTNNSSNAGYVYVDFGIKPFNPVSPETIKLRNLTDAQINKLSENYNYVKLTSMYQYTNKQQSFLISSGLSGNPCVGYCDPTTNLPFIIEFEKRDFETQCNALLKDLYENSSLMKFGSFAEADGFPASDYCVLPEDIKQREYKYENGYLIGWYNRHCLLCFLTNQKFTSYVHSATFTSPASSHEPDDDCFVMVVSAVDSNEIYCYDTLSFVIKLNNDQTHCGVPAEVQCALVYNVFLPNQMILKEDETMWQVSSPTRGNTNNWNGYAKGMAIKAIKTDERIDIYRTDIRRADDPDQFERIDPDISSPVLSMSFSEILSRTGIDFTEGYLGYGNISQAEAHIKNIDITAEDADVMNDLKSKQLEYIAATDKQDIELETNDKTDYLYETYQSEVGITQGVYNNNPSPNSVMNGIYTASMASTYYNTYKNTYKIGNECYKYYSNGEFNCFSTPPVAIIKDKLYSFCYDRDYYQHGFGNFYQAAIYDNLVNTYNDKMANNWDVNLYYANKDLKDSPQIVIIDDAYYLSIPNIFREDIQGEYKNFTQDVTYYTLAFENVGTEEDEKWDAVKNKTKSMNITKKREARIDSICINISEDTSFGYSFILARPSDEDNHLDLYNLKSKNELTEDDYLNRRFLNYDMLKIKYYYTNVDPNPDSNMKFNIFYYDENYTYDNILIKLASKDKWEENLENHGYIGKWFGNLDIGVFGYQRWSLPKTIGRYTIPYNKLKGNMGNWSPTYHNYPNIKNFVPSIYSFCTMNNGARLSYEDFGLETNIYDYRIKEENDDEIILEDIVELGNFHTYSMCDESGGKAIIVG